MGQHDGVVVLFVVGCVNQGDRWLAGNGLPESGERLPPVREFVKITLLELRPAVRGVSEPKPELSARCKIPGPEIDGCPGFGQTAWPEPVDQDPETIRRLNVVIDALDPDGRHRPSPLSRATLSFYTPLHAGERGNLNRVMRSCGWASIRRNRRAGSHPK